MKTTIEVNGKEHEVHVSGHDEGGRRYIMMSHDDHVDFIYGEDMTEEQLKLYEDEKDAFIKGIETNEAVFFGCKMPLGFLVQY